MLNEVLITTHKNTDGLQFVYTVSLFWYWLSQFVAAWFHNDISLIIFYCEASASESVLSVVTSDVKFQEIFCLEIFHEIFQKISRCFFRLYTHPFNLTFLYVKHLTFVYTVCLFGYWLSQFVAAWFHNDISLIIFYCESSASESVCCNHR